MSTCGDTLTHLHRNSTAEEILSLLKSILIKLKRLRGLERVIRESFDWLVFILLKSSLPRSLTSFAYQTMHIKLFDRQQRGASIRDGCTEICRSVEAIQVSSGDKYVKDFWTMLFCVIVLFNRYILALAVVGEGSCGNLSARSQIHFQPFAVDLIDFAAIKCCWSRLIACSKLSQPIIRFVGNRGIFKNTRDYRVLERLSCTM